MLPAGTGTLRSSGHCWSFNIFILSPLKFSSYVMKSFRHLGANDADAMEKKRKSKLNPDEGFSSFENATFRKYGRLTAQIKPDMEVYAENKEKAGEAFYATVGTVVHGVHKVNITLLTQ